jgi:hypothetical protein
VPGRNFAAREIRRRPALRARFLRFSEANYSERAPVNSSLRLVIVPAPALDDIACECARSARKAGRSRRPDARPFDELCELQVGKAIGGAERAATRVARTAGSLAEMPEQLNQRL